LQKIVFFVTEDKNDGESVGSSSSLDENNYADNSSADVDQEDDAHDEGRSLAIRLVSAGRESSKADGSNPDRGVSEAGRRLKLSSSLLVLTENE